MRTRPCPLPLPERLSPRLLNKAVGEMKAGAIGRRALRRALLTRTRLQAAGYSKRE